MTLTDQQIANVALDAGWSGNDVVTATAVALAESNGNETATHRNVNGSTDYGLWQVNSAHLLVGGLLYGKTTVPSLLTPIGNAAAAHTVWAAQGWNAWSTYKSGAYQLYMGRARKVAVTASASGGGPGGSVVNPSPLEALGKAAMAPIAAAAWLANPHNSLRIVEVIGGVALVIAGLAVVASSSKAARTVRKVVV